jgi:hypothetical protein
MGKADEKYDLKHTVKGHEPHTAQTAAWASQTGEGLLLYVKDESNKEAPQALNLVSAPIFILL